MKKLITLVGLYAACAALGDESTSKTVVRPLKWESAVKADVPPPPVAKRAAVKSPVAEPVSKPIDPPLFYSAQRNVPPLPFNPYPKLPLFDLGDNKFMYDDREVDYSSRSARVALASEASGAMEEMEDGAGASGPAAMTYSASDLWLNITKSNPTNGFLLDVNNTVSGTYYGVGAKSSLDPDPFNTWTLVSTFPATSTNQQLAGTATAATRFYNAVNLDAYTGPSVSIVSPATNATVSGDVAVQVAIIDILPLTNVEVYVGAVQVGVIRSGQNGLVNVPSSLFANGSHQIWVRALNVGVPVDTDGDTVADSMSQFEGWGSVTLNFSNSVSMQNYSPLYSTAGSITLQYATTSKQDYTFEIFKTNGTLLHTASGESVNGSINGTWNFTDLSGQPVDDAAYISALTYSPHGTAALVPGKIYTTFSVDKGVTVGKYVISYHEYPNSALNSPLHTLAIYLSSDINEAWYYDGEIIGNNRQTQGIIYPDFSSEPFRITHATQTNDILALTNALKDVNTGSWFYDGHAAGSLLISDGDGYITVDLTPTKVADCLGTTLVFGTNSLTAKYGRRLFSTILSGCGSANGEFPTATGTPPGVPQVGNSQMKKSVFLGFIQASHTGATNNAWDHRVHQEWIDGYDYDTPLDTALNRANFAFPSVLSWRPIIYGHRFLKYNGDESR